MVFETLATKKNDEKGLLKSPPTLLLPLKVKLLLSHCMT